jgi:enhancing lycopene biosynthesis protein 2
MANTEKPILRVCIPPVAKPKGFSSRVSSRLSLGSNVGIPSPTESRGIEHSLQMMDSLLFEINSELKWEKR